MSAGRQTRTSVTKLKVTPSKSPSPSSVVVDSTAESGCQNCTQLLATQNQLLATQAELLRTIKELNTRIGSLETTVANLQKNATVADDEAVGISTGLSTRLREIEEVIEERTNRQLRKTLVVRGIPELDGEKWVDTESILSKKISETLKVEVSVAAGMIDRCHRGGNPHYYKDKPRPIFAAMHSWKMCEDIIWEARKKKTMFVEYKYGPLTTRRRSLALKKRKELIESGTLVKAHVAYPARLMGKSANDKKYRKIEDFSNADVRDFFKKGSI